MIHKNIYVATRVYLTTCLHTGRYLKGTNQLKYCPRKICVYFCQSIQSENSLHYPTILNYSMYLVFFQENKIVKWYMVF